MTARSIIPAIPLSGPDGIPVREDGGKPFVTRFAPSPTGLLHIGHAYSALFACELANRSGGRFLLRIEDIDTQRCRSEFFDAITEDLQWLGINWSGSVFVQSERMPTYEGAIRFLREVGVAYPCFCSRKQIRAEVEESGRAPHGVSGELLYPGICRHLDPVEQEERMAQGMPFAWRLDVMKAVDMCGPLHWYDYRGGWQRAMPELLGDVVLARKDTPTSYHLSVTLDDHEQGVTLVSRGEDLFHATHVHRLLQALLGLETPEYYHHNLVANSTGQRLAKRNRAVTLRHLRAIGKSPADIWRMVGLAAQ